MVEVWLPYGNTEICLSIPAENLVGVLNPNTRPQTDKFESIITKALEKPVNLPQLRQVVKPDSKISILLDESLNLDELKTVTSKLIEELQKGQIEYRNIIFLIGSYVDSSSDEKKNAIKEVIPADIQLASHDPRQESELVEIGSTSFKSRVFVNKIFSQADIKIVVGKIGLHPYAGFSGGSHTLLQACGIRTIHHNYNFSIHPNSRVGILSGNPVHEDEDEIARMCRVNFALNMAVDEKGTILDAFYGDFETSYVKSVKFLESLYTVTTEDKADIVIVSPGGSEFDYSFYKAQESLEIAARVAKEGNVIILIAECAQGHGSSEYLRWYVEAEDFKDFLKKDFFYGMHKNIQLKEISERFKVILTSTLPENIATGIFKFRIARRVNDALEMAFRLTSKKAKTMIIPYAMRTLPVIKSK